MAVRSEKLCEEAETDLPLTLAEAVDMFFPGKATIATLRAEAARGHLTVYEIGRQIYTTRADVIKFVSIQASQQSLAAEEAGGPHKDIKEEFSQPFYDTPKRGRRSQLSQQVLIYFLKIGPFVKIGRTNNFPDRLRALQTASPTPIKIFHVQKMHATMERQLHLKFRDFHIRGEWFELSDEIIEYVIEMQRVRTT